MFLKTIEVDNKLHPLINLDGWFFMYESGSSKQWLFTERFDCFVKHTILYNQYVILYQFYWVIKVSIFCELNYWLVLWNPLHLITKTLYWSDIKSDQYASITLSFSLEDKSNWYSCGHANGILLNK